MSASQPLILKTHEPIASGACRLVYRHPDHHDQLIKVIRPDIIEKRFGKEAPRFRFKSKRRFGRYLSFYRELTEHLVARAEAPQPHPFLHEIMGLVETDLGLGLVVRAVLTPEGELAPTLRQLIDHGRFNAQIETDLEKFFSQMLASRVAFSDLNAGGLVYRERERQFVMIDGLGIANPIPLKGISAWINRRSKRKRFARFRRRIAELRKRSAATVRNPPEAAGDHSFG